MQSAKQGLKHGTEKGSLTFLQVQPSDYQTSPLNSRTKFASKSKPQEEQL